MTKFQLMSLLFASSNVKTTIGRHTGYVLSVEREDGSGNCFNVNMLVLYTDNEKQDFSCVIPLFVRTID